MARGELVGDAYVRIHADTTFMRRAINRAAQRDADDYEKTFSKKVQGMATAEFERRRNLLARAVALQDFSVFEEQFGSVANAVQRVREEMDALVMENRIYARDVKVVENSLKKWAVKAQVREEMDRAHEAALKYLKDLDNAHIAAIRMNDALKRQEQIGERLAAQAERSFIKKMSEDWHLLRREMQRSGDEGDRVAALFARNGVNVKQLAQKLVVGHTAMTKVNKKTQDWNKSLGSLQDRIGATFGRGSRNDFLNFFGSMVRGITQVAALPFTAIVKGVSGLTGMAEKFTALRTSGAGLGQALLGAVGPALASVTAGLIGLGAAIVAGAIAIPTLVSGLWLLVGALTAIAGAISIGIVGAMLPLVPLGAALLAALGPVVATIQAMGEESGAAANSLKRIKAGWDETVKGMNVTGIADAFADVFTSINASFLKPLMTGMGTAFQDVVRHFGSVLKDPQIKGFLDIWETALPAAFESLGKGFNHLLGGIIGFFTPILGPAAELSSRFEGLMKRFSEWTQSAEGQNSISEFMTMAWEAANSLWEIITNVGAAIGKVFSAGTEGAGQDFLTYLADVTERFNTWLGTEEGKEAMTTFFSDVRDVMITVRDILGELGTSLANMDTEQARDNFQTFMDAVSSVAGAIEWATRAMDAITVAAMALSNPLFFLLTTTPAVSQAFGALKNAFDIAVAGFTVGMGTFELAVATGAQAVIDIFLEIAVQVTETAAAAFSWVPGLGPKLEAAAENVRGFKDKTNAHMEKVKKEYQLKVDTAQAALDVANLANKINSIKDKSVVITATQRFVNTEKGSTAGGLTFASGGVVGGPVRALVGEAGPEAIVPLNRPLSLVDPAVRALSAIAQGKATPALASGGVIGGGRTINIAPGAIVVQSPHRDPALVAEAVFDRIVQFG